jgi:hypothetical protein
MISIPLGSFPRSLKRFTSVLIEKEYRRRQGTGGSKISRLDIAVLIGDSLNQIHRRQPEWHSVLPAIPSFTDQINTLADLESYGDALNAYSDAQVGLSSLAPLINSAEDVKAFGQDLIRIGRADHSRGAIDMSPLIDLVRVYGMDPFIAFAQAAGPERDNRSFLYVLPPLKELIREYGMEVFVELARSARAAKPRKRAFESNCAWFSERNVFCVFAYGLPIIANTVRNRHDLELYGRSLIEVGVACHYRLELVFKWGLPVFEDYIKSADDVRVYGQMLAEICVHVTDEPELALRNGIPRILATFLNLLTSKDSVIADLKNIRRHLRNPVYSSPDRDSGGLSTGGAGPELVQDIDRAAGVGELISALEHADFSDIERPAYL